MEVMDEKFEVSELYKGRPNEEVSEKISECFELLENIGVNYETVVYNKPPKLKEELIAVDNAIGVKGIKNLMFKTKNGQAFFLVIIYRDSMFDTKAFRNNHNIPKIEMCKNDDLEKLLNTTAGSVSITQLINDKEGLIKIYIDKKILDEKYFRFHPNETGATVRISMNDLKNKLIPYLQHELNII